MTKDEVKSVITEMVNKAVAAQVADAEQRIKDLIKENVYEREMNVYQASQFLGLSPDKIEHHIKAGTFKGTKDDKGDYWLDREELARFKDQYMR